MKKVSYLVSIIFTTLALTSCGTYQQPNFGNQPQTTVSGLAVKTNELYIVDFVYSIDNQTVGMVWDENSKIKVVPGSHLFVIKTGFNKSFSTNSFFGITKVYATLQKGMNYKFISVLNGETIYAWAIDAAGHRVSEIGSSEKIILIPKIVML